MNRDKKLFYVTIRETYEKTMFIEAENMEEAQWKQEMLEYQMNGEDYVPGSRKVVEIKELKETV